MRNQRRRGFTLVEVLVALAIMAVLAALSWRGIDAMLRARDGSAGALERTERLNTILAQWQQDFAALTDAGVVPPLAFNGRTLLVVRSQADGVQIVAWALNGTRWQRWTSAPTQRAATLQDDWMRAQQLLGNEPAQVTLLDDVSDWQLYYYRGNGWSNAQSTGNVVVPTQPPAPQVAGTGAAGAAGDAGAAGAATPAGADGTSGVTSASGATGPTGGSGTPAAATAPREALPDGVRLVVTTGGAALTRDLVLQPHP